MSNSNSAQGSWIRALRATPLGLTALLAVLVFCFAGGPSGPLANQIQLAGYGSSGPGSIHDHLGSPAPAQALTPAFGIAGTVAGLYPGSSSSLILQVTNHESFAIVVTSIVTTVHSASASCTAAKLAVGAFSGQLSVPAFGSAQASVLASMASSVSNSCKGASFPLVYKGLGKKA